MASVKKRGQNGCGWGDEAANRPQHDNDLLIRLPTSASAASNPSQLSQPHSSDLSLIVLCPSLRALYQGPYKHKLT